MILNAIGASGGGGGLELIEEGTYTQEYNRTSLQIPITTNIKGYSRSDGMLYVEAEPQNKTEYNNYVIKCYGIMMGYFGESIYFATMSEYGSYQPEYDAYLITSYTGSTSINQLYFYANNSSIYFRSGTWNYRIYKLP